VKVTRPQKTIPHPNEEPELGEVTAESDAVREPSADVFDPRDQMMEPSDQLNEPSSTLIESEDDVTPCHSPAGRPQ
jgi:hypothetical protein